MAIQASSVLAWFELARIAAYFSARKRHRPQKTPALPVYRRNPAEDEGRQEYALSELCFCVLRHPYLTRFSDALEKDNPPDY
jgi:hypothetical protein